MHLLNAGNCFVAVALCSGELTLGGWSAVWNVNGSYVTFTVSGDSSGGYVAIGFSATQSMVRMVLFLCLSIIGNCSPFFFSSLSCCSSLSYPLSPLPPHSLAPPHLSPTLSPSSPPSSPPPPPSLPLPSPPPPPPQSPPPLISSSSFFSTSYSSTSLSLTVT